MFRSAQAGTVLAILVFVGPARAQDQPVRPHFTDREQDWIRAHPKVRLMVESHYEPADFIDATGTHAGITADFLHLLADRTGLAFEPVVLPPELRAELDPVKRGVDGVALSALTPKRGEFYVTTTPYLEFPAYILTRRSVNRFLTPADLLDKPVAVVRGYAAQEYLEANYPRMKLVPVADTEAGLQKLSFGEVEAFVSDIPVSTYWLEKEGFANLKIAGETGYVYRMGFMTRKDWPELHGILQKGLDSITYPERDAIRRKWLNLDYEPLLMSKRFWMPVAWVATVGLTVLAMTLFWNRTLSRRVRERTAELKKSEGLLQSCLDTATDAVLLVRPDGSLARAWAAAGTLFGLPPEQLMKRTAAELFGADFEQAVAAAKPDGLRNADCAVADSFGRTRHLLVNVVRLEVHDADRLYLCRDVTERRQLEGELHRRERLETVGLLAGGVAHDFNNILQVILGYTEMAQGEKATPADKAKFLNEVKSAGTRARGLVNQLLTFSGRRKISRQITDLNAMIEGVLSLLRQLVGSNVRVDFVPSPTPAEVNADAGELERILFNLCSNARDAMPHGGVVRIWVKDADPTGPLANVVTFGVEDNGAGMSERVLARIFEPYFTTKPIEQGTGLGLAVAYKVIEEHGGRIAVTSEVGKGTRFVVSLPRVRPSEYGRTPDSIPASAADRLL